MVFPYPSSRLFLQIVIVEDNSKDKSRLIARQLALHFESLNIVNPTKHRLSFSGMTNWAWEVPTAKAFGHARENS